METIDRKFKFVATNPCKGNVYTEENAIIFCAKDNCVPAMISSYIAEARLRKCGGVHIESMELLYLRVLKFQQNVESRLPDTETNCEIDRCIGGKL